MTRVNKSLLTGSCLFSCFSTLSLSIGSHPVLLTPCLAGYPMGLLKILGVPTIKVTGIQIDLISYLGGTNIMLFFSRYELLRLSPSTSLRTVWRYLFGISCFMAYFFVLTILGLNWSVENIDYVRDECLKVVIGDKYPLYYEETIIVSYFNSGENTFVYITYCLSLSCSFVIIIALLGFLTRKNLISLSSSLSSSSMRKHHAFIRLLVIQTILLMVMMVGPAVIALIIHLMTLPISNSQNYCILTIAFGGIFSVIHIMYSIPSYKKAIISLFH